MQRVRGYKETTHVKALERALRNVKHLGPADAPRIKEAFEIAAILDTLDLGKDPDTGRLEILRITRRYDEILNDMALGYKKPIGRPKKETVEKGDATPDFSVVSPLAQMRQAAGLE